MLDRYENTVVLIVDDTPETLALLHDAMVESGFTVLVANSGEAALKVCAKNTPDIILLDAMMPGMDGFETCQQLKHDINTRHIPVIFMTGLTESEHVVAGFAAGGVDYVTKPVSPVEVLARINTHLKTSRFMSQTQGALDAFGQAAIAVLPQTGEIIWQTPLARKLINSYFEDEHKQAIKTPALVKDWVLNIDSHKTKTLRPLIVPSHSGRLILTAGDLHSDEQWLMLLREESEVAQTEALRSLFELTRRESEVLHWVIMGKTDKSIGEILGTSPRTVNKHMEHVFEKLGVETRTAAASLAVNKLRTNARA